jgi:hypothetical protein
VRFFIASKPAVEEINFRRRSAAEQVFVVDTIDGTHRCHQKAL